MSLLMRHIITALISLFAILTLPCSAFAADKILNIYAWGGDIPDSVVRAFEDETGIKVNMTSFENNEAMYSKLRTADNLGYDIVMPSSGYVDRMRRNNMLLQLDKKLIPNYKNIDPAFINPVFDPRSEYSIPLVWGVTGIFVNSKYYSPKSVTRWSDLWDDKFHHRIMLLDDVRDVFSMALISLGYSANDNDPEHIKAAYYKIKKLLPNVKVFASDMSTSIIIDEDVTIGAAWNGDAYKASLENPAVSFIYPQEGFVIWVDNLAVLKNAPHKEAAYLFLNFILKPEHSARASLTTGYPTANLAARKLLPENLRDNPTVYPSKETLKRGEFLADVHKETLALIEGYWEQLKMSG